MNYIGVWIPRTRRSTLENIIPDTHEDTGWMTGDGLDAAYC